MALIDTSILLSDPDFINPVIIVTRSVSVNSFGENVITETSVSTFGSVQPASGKQIQRLPEALRVANMSSFWIKGNISAGAPGKYPDILIFNGVRYQVNSILDYSNYGEGYAEGTCTAEEINP